MMFHNIYTMTIGQYMQMDESKDDSIVLKYPIPNSKKKLKEAKEKLNQEFNKYINIGDVVDMMEDGVHKSSLAIRIDKLIPPLYNGIKMHHTRTGEMPTDEFILSTYKEICYRELKTPEDIEYLLDVQKNLIEKYKELYPEKKVIESTITLTRIVQILEYNMPHPINRESKLYELAGHIQIEIGRASCRERV